MHDKTLELFVRRSTAKIASTFFDFPAVYDILTLRRPLDLHFSLVNEHVQRATAMGFG